MKTVWPLNKAEGGIHVLTVVHMKQLFVTDNYYIQDEGHRHSDIICALWSVTPGESTGSSIKSVKPVKHWLVTGQHSKI